MKDGALKAGKFLDKYGDMIPVVGDAYNFGKVLYSIFRTSPNITK